MWEDAINRIPRERIGLVLHAPKSLLVDATPL